jgi:AraC-like DNA-binding protein
VSTTAEPLVDVVSPESTVVLRGCVHRQVGYRMSGFDAGEHVGMPGSSYTCILSFDAPLELTAMPDPSQSPAALWTLISGLHDGPAVMAHDGAQHGVQLDLTPMGVRALFGVPAGSLGSSVVELAELMGPLAEQLWARSWAEPDWERRFAVVHEVLGTMRSRHEGTVAGSIRPELRWAWSQVVRSGGAVRVDTLAEEIGWSRRHFTDRFRAEFGVSPSTARRLARFEVATGLLRDDQPRGLVEVAARAGYADQSHLSREFRRMAGRSVTEWWADEQFPFVHDTGTEPG